MKSSKFGIIQLIAFILLLNSSLPVFASECVIDTASVSALLNDEKGEFFSAYIPLLKCEEKFIWQDDSEQPTHSVTFSEFHDQMVQEIDDPSPLKLDQAAVLDLDGDGTKELILYFDNFGGHWLILHKTDNAYYGIDFTNRAFLSLQKNGVHTGSNGAEDACYCKLSFMDESFTDQNLACIKGSSYSIEGKDVSKESFQNWMDTNLVGDAEFIQIP